ncbi:cyclophilin-like fold protein [Glutamicibacter arilaitensis]|uniref:cyclophilin-like fold protein n=1 Tax=Glutamicibacter arilaitensis TaxID=256701 RepID=UPI00384BB806
MNIELTINGTRVDAQLHDHPVAHELAGLLPLDLEFDDFNDVEKVADLGRSLTMDGVPRADAPGPGEIGYYAPTRGLVLYYGSPGKWPGLVRMGRFDYDLNALRALPDGTRIHFSMVPVPSA